MVARDLFVFSDVHGDYDALMKGLSEVGYDANNKQHLLVSLGDNFGRADNSRDNSGSLNIFNFLVKTEHANTPIILRGNHESILLDMLKRQDFTYTDLYNGEVKTIGSFVGLTEAETLYGPEWAFKEIQKYNLDSWVSTLPWFFSTKHCIFTHGWLPENKGVIIANLSQVSKTRWHQATWSNSIEKYQNFIEKYPRGYKKVIIVGHFGSHLFREQIKNDGKNIDDIWIDNEHNVIAIDQTLARSHNLKILVIKEEELLNESV